MNFLKSFSGVHAAQFAAQNGYTKLVNYSGGANQWFN
jgi:rhodanese-related sulfurtransferase